MRVVIVPTTELLMTIQHFFLKIAEPKDTKPDNSKKK